MFGSAPLPLSPAAKKVTPPKWKGRAGVPKAPLWTNFVTLVLQNFPSTILALMKFGINLTNHASWWWSCLYNWCANALLQLCGVCAVQCTFYTFWEKDWNKFYKNSPGWGRPPSWSGETSLTFRNQFLPALIETLVRSQTSVGNKPQITTHSHKNFPTNANKG